MLDDVICALLFALVQYLYFLKVKLVNLVQRLMLVKLVFRNKKFATVYLQDSHKYTLYTFQQLAMPSAGLSYLCTRISLVYSVCLQCLDDLKPMVESENELIQFMLTWKHASKANGLKVKVNKNKNKISVLLLDILNSHRKNVQSIFVIVEGI